jgi:hypothetical protein
MGYDASQLMMMGYDPSQMMGYDPAQMYDPATYANYMAMYGSYYGASTAQPALPYAHRCFPILFIYRVPSNLCLAVFSLDHPKLWSIVFQMPMSDEVSAPEPSNSLIHLNVAVLQSLAAVVKRYTTYRHSHSVTFKSPTVFVVT